MVFSLQGERPRLAVVPAAPLRALFAWIAEARARRSRRAALMQLLDFDASMLNDVGIDRDAVVAALRHPEADAVRLLLHARTARSSRDWLSPP